jgi:imidazoleglycerol-phosphate dehydratase
MARIGYQTDMDASPPSPVTDTPPRAASLTRATSETEVTIRLDLDGTGQVRAQTGIGFFDHMLTALGRHALFDLEITATGDLHVDDHHTVEDVGIVLGQLILKTVGEKRGIGRYGQALVPMDEALVEAAIDLSGRATLGWQVAFTRPKIGTMDTELFEEFFRALSANGLFALHLIQKAGRNDHHIAEACFKATARALRMAVEPDPRQHGLIPSTKAALAVRQGRLDRRRDRAGGAGGPAGTVRRYGGLDDPTDPAARLCRAARLERAGSVPLVPRPPRFRAEPCAGRTGRRRRLCAAAGARPAAGRGGSAVTRRA